MFPGINFWNLVIFLRERPCLEVIIVSGNFQALLFLQDKLLESVWKLWIQVRNLKNVDSVRTWCMTKKGLFISCMQGGL